MFAFPALLARYQRIGIVGAPRTGKTTLAGSVGDRRVIGTDPFRDMEWEEVPHAIIGHVSGLSRFVVEGVMVARALRKGLEVDAIVYLTDAKVEQSPGQQAMGKGISTIFRDYLSKTPNPPPIFTRLADGSFDHADPETL